MGQNPNDRSRPSFLNDPALNRQMDPFAGRSHVPPGRDTELRREQNRRDFSNITNSRDSGTSERAPRASGSPARNVPVGRSGAPDTAAPREKAPSSRPGQPQAAVRRRTRLESARPRRTGLRIDFSERQKRSRSGLGVAGA